LKPISKGEGNNSMLQRFFLAAILVCSLGLTGCVTPYIDGAVKEVSADNFKKPVTPAPVQLIFEFQTKGVLNPRATGFLKTQVTEQVQTSGLFASVSDDANQAGGLLSITLNNVPITDDAFAKGFLAGFTFGVVGTTVTDGYVCTVKYFPSGKTEPVVKSTRHAIHASIGATSGPVNATKMDSLEAAVRAMTRQIVSNALNDLSQDPSFK
jgi:hypothetical protein